MNTRFQSALNHIKPDEALINKTEMYLREKLAENNEQKAVKFRRRRFNPLKSLAKAACIIFILAGTSTGTYAYYKMPVSYLSLDINPSIEFGINAFNKVVSAEGYNDDGRTVLNGLDVNGTNIEEAVSTVIKSAARNGFIDNDGSTVVSLTSETDNDYIADKLEQEAEAGVCKALNTEGKKAVIYKDNVALNFRMEAREQNLTPGKLNLINKLAEVNPETDENQYKDAKVTDIMKAIKENTDNVAVSRDKADSSKETASVSKSVSTAESKDKSTDKNPKESTVNNKAVVSISNNASEIEDKNTTEVKNENAVTRESRDNVNSEKEKINKEQKAAAYNNQDNMEKSNKKDAADKKESKVKKRHK